MHCGDVVERAPAEARELLEGRRHDGARTDAVGTDVLPAVLERHRARQVDHAALGRVVRAPEDTAVEALDRRRVDDRPAAALEHARDGGPHPVEDPGQHDPEAPFPDLGVQLADVAAARPVGVVVDDVEAAVALDGEGDHRLDLGERADVGVAVHGLAARVANRREHPLARLVGDVRADDAGSLFREAADRRGADARRAAGDDCDLAGESAHGRWRCNKRSSAQSTDSG